MLAVPRRSTNTQYFVDPLTRVEFVPDDLGLTVDSPVRRYDEDALTIRLCGGP
jgi:hypothetical protein